MRMLSRLVYAASAVCLVGLMLFAVVIPEAFDMPQVRLIVATLMLGIVVACWWASRRSASVIGPRILAGVALVLGVVGAFLTSSARKFCACPMPRGAKPGFSCDCGVDQHIGVRIALVVTGLVLCLVLASTARKRMDRNLAPAVV
jgi:hypothetical protein